jgi:hypothetical protein
MTLAQSEVSANPEGLIDAVFALVQVAKGKGNTTETVELYERALAKEEKLYGPAHREVLKTLEIIADFCGGGDLPDRDLLLGCIQSGDQCAFHSEPHDRTVGGDYKPDTDGELADDREFSVPGKQPGERLGFSVEPPGELEPIHRGGCDPGDTVGTDAGDAGGVCGRIVAAVVMEWLAMKSPRTGLGGLNPGLGGKMVAGELSGGSGPIRWSG